MITAASFYGGGVYVTSTSAFVITRNTPRVITFNVGSGTNVLLPDPDTFSPGEKGGPMFVITNIGAATLTIKKHDGTTLGTVASTDLARVYCGSSFFFVTRTRNAVRTATSSSRSAPERSTAPKTYDPFCFEGDECEYAVSLGMVPMDGVDGRLLVVAPFFQNSCAALNEDREAIRAADLVMPSIIPVKFFRDEFVPDPAHPLASTVLSEEFYETLYNYDRAFFPQYYNSAHGTTRHWHHIRKRGTAPSSPTWGLGSGAAAFSVKRHIWRQTKDYTTSGGQTYTLEVRVVMEHSVDPEPTVTPTGTGGKNNANYGAWGAIFSVYVFTNELLPAWSDGSSHTPAGGSSGVTFTRNDPAVWGNAFGVSGGDDEDKFCHPQMVLCASVPLTFHAPCGQNYVPHQDRAYVGSQRMDNREYCYTVGNGAPWCSINESPNAISDDYGILRNIVFGIQTSVTNMAAMTTGGDLPRSKPTEWLCFENGAGVGRTYLKPLKPGWDEARGELTVSSGSSGSIRFCVEDEYGLDDGSGHKVWPRYEPDNCAGHPDEPFEGIGGTHNCFHNNGSGTSTKCCVEPKYTTAVTVEKCLHEIFVFGPDVGGTCDLPDENYNKRIVQSYSTSMALQLEDYTYVAGGDQTTRIITWAAWKRDPALVQYDYVYSASDTGDLVSSIGSFTFGSTVDVATTSGSAAFRAVLLYSPAGDLRDFTLTGKYKTTKSYSHGSGARVSVSGGLVTGYVAMIEPTGGDNATVSIKYYNSGVATTLATKNITNLVDNEVTFEFSAWGTTISFGWTVKTQDSDSLTADECTLASGGKPALLMTGSASAGASASNLELNDQYQEYTSAEAQLARTSSRCQVPWKMMNSYGKCNTTINPDCGVGTPPMCECETRNQQLVGGVSAGLDALHNTGADIVPADCPTSTEGDNPTYCGGPNPKECLCDGPKLGELATVCDCCPSPFVVLSWCIPFRCLPDGEAEANLCKGLDYWFIETCTPGNSCADFQWS